MALWVLVLGAQGKVRPERTFEKDSTGRNASVSTLRTFAYNILMNRAVFALAQESARRAKQWYESSDKARR